jgi:shikimate kinase
MTDNDYKKKYKSNIILIGMPGAGKSTIGPALAECLGMQFMDTDDVVAEMAGMPLKEYVAQYGKESFLELQESSILCLKLSDYVLATGGSVGCSPSLMQHLKKDGYAVYLKLAFTAVEQRLAPGRRLARDGGKTLEDLYRERTPLYEANADIIVECTERPVEDIVEDILGRIG